MVDIGLSQAALMHGFANNEDYLEIYVPAPNMQEEIQKMAGANPDAPSACIVIDVSDSALTSFLNMEYGDCGKVAFTEQETNFITGRALLSFVAFINGWEGTTTLSASSTFSINESYKAHPDLASNKALIFVYDNSPYAICTSFRPSMDETMTATTSYVKLPENWHSAITEGTFGEHLSDVFSVTALPLSVDEIGVHMLSKEQLEAIKLNIVKQSR